MPVPHSETVYESVKRDIMRGVLAPGAPPREVDLGRSHRVSRTPVREAFEGLAARLAERCAELDLTRLRMVLQASERDMREISLGEEFHILIWRIAGNAPLQRAINDVYEVVQRFQPNTLTYPGRAAQSLGEDQDLLEAIRARDPIAAERVAVEDVRHVRNTRIAISIDGDQKPGGDYGD